MNRLSALVPAAIGLSLFLSLPVSAQYALQFGSAVAADGEDVFVGEGRNLLQPGKVIVYTRSGSGAWSESARLQPSAENDGDGFGRAMVAAAGLLAVGAPDDGLVYVFERSDGGQWMERARIMEDAAGYGSSVAVDGEHLIVGAVGDRDHPGTVFAYARSEAGGWVKTGRLDNPSGEERNGYGSVVAIHGSTAVIAAPNAESRQGRAYVFEFDTAAEAWSDGTGLQIPGAEDGDRAGVSLVAAGDMIAVGLPGRDQRTGAVAVFMRGDDGSFELSRRLTAFDTQGGEQFGESLALVEGSLLVGAPGAGDSEGAIYRFDLNDDGGAAAVHVSMPDNLQYRSGFGARLAASGSAGVAGAPGFDNFEGAAFPFSLRAEGVAFGPPVYSDSGVFSSVTGEAVECSEDEAGGFPCADVDMLSFLSRADVGAKRGIQMSDVWGWTDPETGREYALIGRTDGTSFVDLTDPSNPVYVGDLPKTETANQSLWRDIKTYRNYAYIVADGAGAHHMQIFDLTRLRDVQNPPVEFTETNIYRGVYSSHNIVINEESGFAYAVGSDSGGETCGGALHMIDLSDPVNPTFAGCFSDTRTGRGGSGTTHDAQCVLYRGPDADYQGREICLSSNGTALSIADVTDKSNPVAVSFADYPSVAYAHQGWLTEDHRYFFLNDEGDEVSDMTDGTRTMIFDLTDLDEPVVANQYVADHNAIDHNLYVQGNLMYQTNYLAGLRIMDISDPENPVEVAHFDTVPYGPNDNSPVLGAWSNYPYFESGVIVVTSGREGVFFLKKKEIDI
ncbi:MAG: choice-of-anchor B family protein [Rhodothermales bacterium]|nr:choice-of-anchor B family protein [Rhodothermales bacterium]